MAYITDKTGKQQQKDRIVNDMPGCHIVHIGGNPT
jgi:hypothetical protein